MKQDFQSIMSYAKEYGFVYPSSEIYDGLQGVYDYGQQGVELRNNIKTYWWKAMVQMHDNIVGIDASILMDPKVWKASGHIEAFHDPLIDNKDSKKRYRADVLIEDHMAKMQTKIEKEVTKATKRFGDAFDKEQFLSTNPRVLSYKEKYDVIETIFKSALENQDLEAIRSIIVDEKIVCPVSGTCNWTDVRQFNLMFETQTGSVASQAQTIYLRPETAQGIFVNFLNVQKTARKQVPFGIAQIGKAFRNEIIARQFIFRMKEFEQMEMQFFVEPNTEMRWYEYWKEKRMQWHLALGLAKDKYHFHDHLKPAHYANAAVDIEFDFPFGRKELEGIHSRTDYDLASHQSLSGKKMQYYDAKQQSSYVPYVVETSLGLDRMFLSVLCSSYTQEDKRTWLRLPAILAPSKVAVLPLVRKDGLDELAKKIFQNLKMDYQTAYDEKDSIGRRYARQDLLGTPYCITIDHQSLEDQSVTIRERDTTNQERITIDKLDTYLSKHLSWKTCLSKL